MKLHAAFSAKKWILWIPVAVLLLNASVRILYWEGMEGGQGYAGGGFGPFCAPQFKYVLVAKFSINNGLFLYKGDMGEPIKNIMLPSKNILDEIKNRIYGADKYVIKHYNSQVGEIVGEISVGDDDSMSAEVDTASTLMRRVVHNKDVDFVQLDLWELNDDKAVIQLKTRYSLISSFKYK